MNTKNDVFCMYKYPYLGHGYQVIRLIQYFRVSTLKIYCQMTMVPYMKKNVYMEKAVIYCKAKLYNKFQGGSNNFQNQNLKFNGLSQRYSYFLEISEILGLEECFSFPFFSSFLFFLFVMFPPF